MDTIAAIATAAGGGVGVVRVSGARAESIARALVPSLPTNLASHKLVLGEARDPVTGEVLDQVLVTVMRAPRSYTGEDVAELHGHGGQAVLEGLLAAALAAGARLATPGEFTRRAYLGGKIDLTQAEAVALLIGARDRDTLRAAQALRRGTLGRLIDDARRLVVGELAEIEGAIDFPEDANDAETPQAGAARLGALIHRLRETVAQAPRPLGVVPEILLVGRVNAGKSSLLNALVGHERALVDEQPGTTRDTVEAELELGGRLVRLVDTAGEREEATALERRGQAIARGRWDAASLALCVYDGGVGWLPSDDALRGALERAGLPTIVVRNKADLTGADRATLDVIAVSARTGEGLPRLRDALLRGLGAGSDEGVPVASARQSEAIGVAVGALERAMQALTGSPDQVAAPEVAAVELRRALHALGQVTGETVDEAVLDAIFARFCIGK